jgi:hypothetical protein
MIYDLQKNSYGRPWRKYDNNTKMDLEEVGWQA